MVECFKQISEDSDCRSVVLSGAGKSFTAGKALKYDKSNTHMFV